MWSCRVVFSTFQYHHLVGLSVDCSSIGLLIKLLANRTVLIVNLLTLLANIRTFADLLSVIIITGQNEVVHTALITLGTHPSLVDWLDLVRIQMR